MGKIRALLVYPKQLEADIIEIENDLKTLQGLVGGYIETWRPYVDENILFLMNEEAKRMGLEPNRLLSHPTSVYVAGTFVVVGFNSDGDFIGLDDEQVSILQDHLISLFTPIMWGRP